MPADPENPLTPADFPPAAPGRPAASPSPLPREIWEPRDLLLLLVFIPFGLVASKLAVLIGYSVVRPLAGWRSPAGLAQENTIFQLVQQCAFYVLILGLLALLARLRHHRPLWVSLGWRAPTRGQAAAYLLAGAGLALAVSLAISLRPDTPDFPLEKLFNSRPASYAIGAFAVTLAPVVEEVVFRGLLFALCERAAGMRFAVAATAVLFAGLHVPEYWPAWDHLLMILLVGVALSSVRAATGSLASSILVHVGYNALLMAGLFAASGHFRHLGGVGV